MGMIYKRGRTYWLKYYRNGKPYYESTGTQKEADARKLLKKREGEISEGKLPGVYFDRVRFDELAKDYLREYRLNCKAIKRAERNVSHLKVSFEGIRVTNITTPKIQGYIEDRLNEDAAHGTINRELAALKAMLNLGATQTPPKVDRVPSIKMLKENNARKGFFEHGDFLALRDALPDYLKGFATFAYKTGTRVSEISSIEWRQVEFDQRIVRLEKTKNDEDRDVYLDDEEKEIFDQAWEARKRGKKLLSYVFLNRKGNDKVKQFTKAWQRACQDAGIGKRFFHDFRRSAIRNMVRAGIPEKVAMMISGHRTRSVFERYNIVNKDDLRLAAQKQEAYLNSQKVTKTVTIEKFQKKRESSNGA